MKKKVTPIAPLTEFVPALRYVDKATGNIYQTFTDQINERKFSNMEIEGIYEAYFGNNGNTVISRYLKSSPLFKWRNNYYLFWFITKRNIRK